MSLLANIDELRQYVSSDLPDEVLESHALAADADIVSRYGPNFEDITPPLVKIMYGGFMTLLHVPEVVSEIRENGVLLVAGTDYRKRQDHVYERLPLFKPWGFTHPQLEVEVRYAPVDDTEQRKRVAVQLIQLSADYSGHTLLRVGDLQVSSSRGIGQDYASEKQRILASLRALRPVVA